MRWILKPKPDPLKVEELKKALQVDDIVATLLLQRGIDTYDAAKTFFRPSFSELHDPFLMKDMDKAVARIEKAIEQGENIMIYIKPRPKMFKTNSGLHYILTIK